MKKTSATMFSPVMEFPVITKRFTRRSKRRKLGKTEDVNEPIHNVVPPPSEELIERLNRLGQEYPFCVCFKQKAYDPL